MGRYTLQTKCPSVCLFLSAVCVCVFVLVRLVAHFSFVHNSGFELFFRPCLLYDLSPCKSREPTTSIFNHEDSEMAMTYDTRRLLYAVERGQSTKRVIKRDFVELVSIN